MYKLIALDMDGTLLNSEKEITPRTVAALTEAKDRGVKIVLASGRPLDGLKESLAKLNLITDDQFSLSFNGGMVVSNGTKQVIHKATLKGKDLKDLVKLAKELGVHWHAFNAQGLITDENSTYTQHEADINKIDINIVDPMVIGDDEDIVKVMFVDEPAVLNEAITKLPKWIKERFNSFKSAPFFYEFTNQLVDKGQGLKRLGEYLGIDQVEIIACGDEENDYSMVKYAGLGVAMANGIDHVKSVANYITDTNDNEGIAQVVEKFILNK